MSEVGNKGHLVSGVYDCSYGKYFEGINSSQSTWSNSGNPQGQFSEHEIRWPIPFNEMQLNSNLVQNPGY